MCDCAKKKFSPAQGTAKQCGHQTNRRGMQWCTKCALMKKVCPACGESIEAKKPVDDRK